MTPANQVKMRQMVNELVAIHANMIKAELETVLPLLSDDLQVEGYQLPKAFLHAAYSDLADRTHPVSTTFRNLAEQIRLNF